MRQTEKGSPGSCPKHRPKEKERFGRTPRPRLNEKESFGTCLKHGRNKM